ncbi:putative toxin [Xanthomonas euvesicatoria]|uniref:putative toxin n=1 Tax=Xanthomonas euvesicatoria TaxID=456327 RepID=UPI00131CB4AF|nr:putative toxin [Xanthomonas euvesicatoria]QTK46671.1 hypothetical protein XeaCFBP3836p_15900 [Xanthomonas euvesicatoria pv. alfalfae]
MGELGVRLVADIGEKAAVLVNGRIRIPDGIIKGAVSEVKNVKSQDFTKQLRGYAQFAQSNGREFNLYIRSGTKLGKPLQEVAANGKVNICVIGQVCP